MGYNNLYDMKGIEIMINIICMGRNIVNRKELRIGNSKYLLGEERNNLIDK